MEPKTFAFDSEKPEIIVTNEDGVEMVITYEFDHERELDQTLLRFVGYKEIVFRKEDVGKSN